MVRRIDCERPDGTRVHIAISARGDGDFGIDAPPAELVERRRRIIDRPWAVVRQVHGNRVVDGRQSGPDVEADGIVTGDVNRPIAVQGADCAPLAFITNSGPIGVAHVGWRGLAGGMIDAMIERLGRQDTAIDHVVMGPTIGVECYAFSEADLEPLVERFGPAIRGRTDDGHPALDLAEGIRAALAVHSVADIRRYGGCTACSGDGFSHRADADHRRLALVAWIDD